MSARFIVLERSGLLSNAGRRSGFTERHAPEDLVGRQVVAVVNVPPKRVTRVTSEVLVLGAVDGAAGTMLLVPTHPVADGMQVA